MRLLCLLLVAVCAVGCGGGRPKPQSVKKYCAMTTMPRTTAADLHAIHERGVKLFEERKPYLKNDVNERVVSAASALTTGSLIAARQLEHPEMFPGQPKGLGLYAEVTELASACNILTANEKGHT